MTDIERKLAAACTSGAVAYVLLGILAAYKVAVPVQVAELIPLAVGALGGYLTHSVGATTHSVVTEPTGRVVETTTTGAIALPVDGASFSVPGGAVASDRSGPQPGAPNPSAPLPPAGDPAPADPPPYEVPDSAPYLTGDAPTGNADVDPGATQIIPPSAGAQAWAARYLRTSETGGN